MDFLSVFSLLWFFVKKKPYKFLKSPYEFSKENHMNLKKESYGFFKENHMNFFIVMVFYLVFSLLWFFYSYQMSEKP